MIVGFIQGKLAVGHFVMLVIVMGEESDDT